MQIDDPEAATVTLTNGAARAVLRPDVGGRIGELEIDGRQLIRRENDGEVLNWGFWGAYPMLPWSNRIPDGRFEYGGQRWQVPVNWPDGTAIHGLTAWTPWAVTESTDTTARLGTRVSAALWELDCWSRFELSDRHLRWELGARNDADRPVPVGMGIHPWFPGGDLSVPADEIWPAIDSIPTGPPRPVSEEQDLRGSVHAPEVDGCYTGLTDRHLTVSGIRMSWGGPIRHVVAYTADPDWYAIEPVTNVTDGFNLKARGVPRHGVIDLERGASVAVTYELRRSS